MLTQEQARELFDYREDGNLIWKVRLTKSVRIGDVAGSNNPDGRRRLRIFGLLPGRRIGRTEEDR